MRQHRSVLEDDDFIAWANENAVCAVGHDGAVGDKKDHEPTEATDPKTKEKRPVCPTYAGLTCDEHRAVKRDALNAPDGTPKVPGASGVPNHWLVKPDGTVDKIEGEVAADPKKLIEALTEAQKSVEGKPLAWKKWDGHRKSLEDGDKAVEAGKWKAALAAYAKVDADAKKLPPRLVEKVAAKAKALNDRVAAALAEARDGEGDDAAKLKAVKALRSEVGQRLSTGPLPVVAEIDAWLKEHAAPKVASK